MTKKHLYQKIFHYYKEKILSGEFAAGEQLPTEKEMTQSFNVSRITVIRALKELELNKFIYRKQGKGSFVNDGNWKISKTPSFNASKLSILSLVLPFESGFPSSFLAGVEEVAKDNNFLVTIHNSSGKSKEEKEIIDEVISYNSHGIILYPKEITKNMKNYTELIIKKYPVVLIDRKIPGLNISLVCSNNQKDMFDLTSYLIKIGHKKMIFVGTTVYTISSEYKRYKGFCQAHIDNGVPLLNMHLFSDEDIRLIPSDYLPNETDNRRTFNYLFDILENLELYEKPTAIVAVNDYSAKELVFIAQERGISIPNTYSITGFDDLPFASQLQVPLTTIAQPAYEIGKMAALELLNLIKNPDKRPVIHKLDGKLIIRESTRSITDA